MSRSSQLNCVVCKHSSNSAVRTYHVVLNKNIEKSDWSDQLKSRLLTKISRLKEVKKAELDIVKVKKTDYDEVMLEVVVRDFNSWHIINDNIVSDLVSFSRRIREGCSPLT